MIGTLVSMSLPILFLLIGGATTLGLAWWLAVTAEGKDEWLTGDDQ